jgi:peptidoglycan/xylan/chitin deacetylase (PgdA/CDA1 family)
MNVVRITIPLLGCLVVLAGCKSNTPPAPPPTQTAPPVGNAPKTAAIAPKPAEPAAPSNAAKLANFRLLKEDWETLPIKTDKVAITFDGGADDKATALILQTLKQHNVKCTFFLTGFFCRRFPKSAKSIADAGMEIGSHSDTHPHFTKCSDAKIQKELAQSEAIIEKICGVNPKPLFRFPYGDRDKRSIAAVYNAGYQSVRWTLDALDAFGEPKSADFVAQRLTSKVKGGDVILMHVSSIGSAKALPRLFAHLEKKNLKPVLVSDLLLDIPETPKRKLAQK